MRPSLTEEMARVVIEDRIAAAERFRRQEEARVGRTEVRRRLSHARRFIHS
jgi:hypothetical protein